MLSLVVLSFFFCLQAFATESRPEGNQNAYEKGKDMAKNMLGALPDLTKVPLEKLDSLGLKDEKAGGQGSGNKCSSSFRRVPESESSFQNTQTTDSQILVFVSFSMPLVALKNLAEAAEKHNARLIIRGLIENSFKKTAETLKDFESGLEINPELFKEYTIDKAPVFILIEKGKEKARIYGNISLSYAAEKLKEPA